MALMHRIARDRGGAGAIVFAVALPAMIGAVGLGIEVAMWFLEKRRLQEAADSGAIAGALEYRRDITLSTDAALTPYVTAAVNRSTDLAPDVNVNRPPSALSVVTDTTAVEVQLQANHPTYFVRIFAIGSIPISARAVARQGGIGSTACILALGPASCSGTEPVQFSGNGTAVLNDCSVHANGDCNPSVEVGNNTTVTADCITGEQELADATLQNYVGTPPATSTGLFVECPDGPLGGQGSILDPYATISVDPSKFTDPCDFASLPGSNWMERFAEAINPISTAHAGNHGGGGGPPARR